VELPPQANEQAVAHALQQLPQVEFAELDELLTPQGLTPNDPMLGYEWHLYAIAAMDAWSLTTGSPNISIAIIDTGVYDSHVDLYWSSKFSAWWNVYDNNSMVNDVTGHGTMVAGTAAASTNNATGVAGVCWQCKVMPVRVSDLSGNATFSAIASGLTWAADHGARVAVIGYAASESSTVTSAAQYFLSKGGFVVAPSGNESGGASGTLKTAANNPSIFTVGATDRNNLLYSWSNYGNNLDLVAPGCTTSTARLGGYASACGTSYAAAMVAGTAALLYSLDPGLTPAEVEAALENSALDLGLVGWDSTFGSGLLDTFGAITAVGPGDTQLPTVSITSPSNGATVSGTITVSANASDNVGISKVEFYVDGVLKSSDTASPYSYSWGTTSYSNVSHTLMAKAFDAAGNNASYSITVSVQNTPVVITSYSVSNITSSSATINWTTNVASTGTVLYGTSSRKLDRSFSHNVQTTSHSVTLTNLSQGSWYYFQIQATSGSTTDTSPVDRFRTLR